MKFSSIQLYLRHAEQRCSQTTELRKNTHLEKHWSFIYNIFALIVEATLGEEESPVFVGAPSAPEELQAPSVDKMQKSLKECTECKKSFKY